MAKSYVVTFEVKANGGAIFDFALAPSLTLTVVVACSSAVVVTAPSITVASPLTSSDVKYALNSGKYTIVLEDYSTLASTNCPIEGYKWEPSPTALQFVVAPSTSQNYGTTPASGIA